MIFCTGNLIHALVVFKYSYFRNYAVHFDENVTYYTVCACVLATRVSHASRLNRP